MLPLARQLVLVRGLVVTATLLLLGRFAWAQEALHARIDALIGSGQANHVAPPAGDTEFLRRVYLDLTGSIPSSEEARAFLADQSPENRARLVDRLLASPQYARHLAAAFDVMLMERRGDKHVPAAQWRQYLLESFTANKPYNVLAQEILAADGSPEQRAPAKFYLDRDGETNVLTREVGRIFLGQDLQCAQCHNHPLIDDYLQSQYYGIFAFLSRSFVFQPDQKKPAVFAEKAEGETSFTSVFTRVSGTTLPRLPSGESVADPAFAPGEEYEVKPAKNVRPIPKYSRRAQLAKLATGGGNRAFNRNIANRVWAHMMGRGLVDPVDLHHSNNPPSHPELLDVLADEFVAMQFDIKAFLREIALSQAYQRSVAMPGDLSAAIAESTNALPSLQKQLDEAVAADDAAFEVFDQRQTALNDFRKSVTALEGEASKANAAVAAAQKASDEAAGKLAEAKKQLAAKQDVAGSVSEAAAKAKEAAEKLPDNKPVVEAAEQLRAAAAAIAGEVATLSKAADEQTSAAKAAAEKLSESQQVAQKAGAALHTANAKLPAVEADFDAAYAKLSTRRQAVAVAERHINHAKAMVEYGERQAAADASQATLQAALQNLADGKEAAVKLAVQLATAQTAVANATSAHAEVAGKLAAAQKLQIEQQASVKNLAEAAAKADQASQQFPNDTVLAEAADKLKSRVDEYQNQLQETAKSIADLQAATNAAAQKLADATRAGQEATAQVAKAGDAVAHLQQTAQQAQQQRDADHSARDLVYQQIVDQWTTRFAVRPLEPLSPEQLAWSTMRATGLWDKQLAASEAELNNKDPLKPEDQQDPAKLAARKQQAEQAAYEKLQGNVARFVTLFGAGAGQPQGDFFATVDQALFFSNGGEIQGWLAPGGGNLTDGLIKQQDPKALAEAIYMSVLTRRPREAEVQRVADYLAGQPAEARTAAVQEMVWALLASTEFRFNY